MLWIVVDRRSW